MITTTLWCSGYHDIFQSYDDNLQMPVATGSFHEWLKMINIFSLQRRSGQYAILHIYKIVIQLVTDPEYKSTAIPEQKKITPKQNSAAHLQCG